MKTVALCGAVAVTAISAFVVGARAGSLGAVALLKARSRELAATHAAIDFDEDAGD